MKFGDVGAQLTTKLAAMGITTALQLADSNQALIRRTFGVVLERTVCELNGVSCISNDELPAKQQIIVSRSFGQRVTQLQDMHQAVCQYAERAAEKLRQEKQYRRYISVFVRTSPFAPHEPYYANSYSVQLMLATQDTYDIVNILDICTSCEIHCEKLCKLHIPAQTDHRFRYKPIALSDLNRPIFTVLRNR